MTFPEFVLNLRRRLQDRHASTGALITLASEDGVRWTSSELVDICNTSLEELSRLITTYQKIPIFQNLLTLTVVYGSTTLVSGKLIFPNENKVLKILSLSGYQGGIYGEVNPGTFTSYQVGDKEPRKDERFYSRFYNTTDGKYVKVLPADNQTVIYSYIYIVSDLVTSIDGINLIVTIKHDYDSSDITAETVIDITGMDDLLLDLAEREARDREHNWDRAKILDQRIIFKLGVGGSSKDG